MDTNILLRLANLTDPQHDLTEKTIAILATSNTSLYVVPQVFYEFWTVATRPASARGGLGWTPEQADIEVSRFEALFELLTDVPTIYSHWRQLVSTYKVSGLLAHDARLVAAMQVHGLSHILTFDVDDFERYADDGIAAVHPSAMKRQ